MKSADRFWGKVNKTETCWLWIAGAHPTGYGLFWLEGRTVSAHRWAYEEARGSIPEGLQIDHLCRVRNCVNPDHLEAVTPRENVLRGLTIPARNAQKDYCVSGHPFAGANLRLSRGRRVCRACIRIRTERWRQRRAAAA